MNLDNRAISSKALFSTQVIVGCVWITLILVISYFMARCGRDVASVTPSLDLSDGGVTFETRDMVVTAYCPCEICCGDYADGITASGAAATGLFVAAGADIPFYTRVIVPGYAGGQAVPVLDRGGAIKEGCIDVFFSNHRDAKMWGRRILPVQIEDIAK